MAIVRWDSSRDVTALQERISRMLEGLYVDRAACDALMGALVDEKFLFRTPDGAFVRS